MIEAKNADLAKGFTQLAVELFQRQEKLVQKDINIYAVPSNLNQVLSVLFGITMNSPTKDAG